MHLGSNRLFHFLQPPAGRRTRVVTGMLLLTFSFVFIARAQQQQPQQQQREQIPPSTSDLAAQNLSRVGASAAVIKAALIKDPGLIVELKRWVAKDATDHGQVVTESDLADNVIFERLETDIQFRSVATALVQRYGYLIPKINPASDAGKEHEIMLQARAKWIEQEQEAQAAEERQMRQKSLQSTGACNPQSDKECSNAPQLPPNQGGFRRDLQQGVPPPDTIETPFLPILPSGTGNNNALLRAQLSQSDDDTTPQSPHMLPLSGFSATGGISPTGNNMGSLEEMSSRMRGGNSEMAMLGGGAASMGAGTAGASDGLLAAYGSALAGMNPGTSMSPELSSMDTRAAGGSGTQIPNSQASLMLPLDRRNRTVEPPRPPDMMRRPNPYGDIPSLYDMYVQAVAHPSTPRRFGAEVFENGTRDSQLIPMDLPAGPEYVVGPGDGLSVDLWGGVSQRLYRVVDREGRVSLPEVGPVLVSGKSLAAIQENLQQILRTQFRDVSADVSLSRLRTIRIYEVGDLVSPGAYDISSLSTPLNALFAGGGPTQRGSMRILKHYRGTQLVETVDVYDLLLHGVKTDLQRLENGDTVQVPPIGPQVTVEGMVRRPAIYELKDEKSLASVLELAGGLLPTAALRHIEVQRIVAHAQQTMLNLDIPETDNDATVRQKLEAFDIQDGDRVRIFPITPYNQDTIYLEGHVVRPGRYSYRQDMKLTDVIGSYKDLLPEPAGQYAEIIHLSAPDYHPVVESFNLTDALGDPAKAPALHSMDTIRIFSRFDFENPPAVSVLGDVRKPGTYQTSGEIRLSDAVHLAGGLTQDAETGDAQVFRYMPDGKFKIFSVSLGQALGGDPVENIFLEPRDRLLIHRNPNAVAPATVYVQGEVARPGRYPLTSNMRVADLIRVGGGLQLSADTQAADLTKFQWPANDKNALSGQHEVVTLSAALAGDVKSNVPLQNGDVLTIRQLPGWNDLGASINLKGEIHHPGPYGIRPGERLSSVLERAGGFQPDAYPYGAILQRTQVRELESVERMEMINRVRDAQNDIQLLPENDQKQKEAKEIALQQWQETLEELTANPPPGRVTLRISSNIARWKNTPADIEVNAGDTLVIPKKPSYVMVTGQVLNPTAVSFRSGKSAKWYLALGGPTAVANKKAVFVIRADGSVVGTKSNLWSGESLSATLQPGDTVVVPEKSFGGGSIQLQSVLLAAQTASSIASAIFIGLRY